MAIETWQDAIGTLATVKGYPDVVLRIKHIHVDANNPASREIVHACRWWYNHNKPAACVCEVVSGTPPASWGEPVTPFGHYRVAAKDLCLEGEARV